MTNPPRNKGHSRVSSVDERRVTSPRRRTIGPLDLEESPLPILTADPVPPVTVDLTHDFSVLLLPTLFHPLPPSTIPHRSQPPQETPITLLLTNGHFRLAAIKAASLLQSVSGRHYSEIFRLWYIRLACLCLINATDLACAEVKHLQDLSAPWYKDAQGKCLLPWELRVLAVRLQALGYEDWRRGIVQYYELGKECRAEYLSASTESQKEMWRQRLAELGVRVGGALIEMGDWEAAGRHLRGLLKGDEREDRGIMDMLALLYLRIGDVNRAAEFVGGQSVLEVFSLMVEGEWEKAVEGWRQLIERKEMEYGGSSGWPGDEMMRQNLAVCLFYTGKLREARALFEQLIEAGHAFHGLTFNLATIYELCGNNAQQMKMDLAKKVADHGKELPNASFKLV